MPRPQERITLSSTIELQRPVPLQEVADGPTCAAAPTVFDDTDASHISPSVLPVDEDGLSDDEFEQSPFTPTPPTRSELFLPQGYPSYAPRTAGVFRQLAAGHPLSSEPVDLLSHPIGTTAGTYRHDPYFPVLPEWYALMAEAPTEEDCDCIVDEDAEPVAPVSSDLVYAADDWDAPRAATSSSSSETPVTTATRVLEDPFAGIEEELASGEEHDAEAANIDERVPIPAASSAAPRVMCCYFKQSGRCKMGADCWYSHEGDASTPCHYGAICKAGHAHLVKTGNSAVGPRRIANSKKNQSQGAAQRQPSQGSQPATQPPRSAPVRSAPLIPSALPCAFCGDSAGVLLQEFPVYEGNTKSIAYRAHCTNPGCLRVYSL